MTRKRVNRNRLAEAVIRRSRRWRECSAEADWRDEISARRAIRASALAAALAAPALAEEPPANSYGQRPDRDLIAVLERIGERRWRLALPWPQNESNLDLIELVPA